MTLKLFPKEEEHPLHFERRLRQQGYKVVAGIDQAGRGPLAGPVLAAAVVLPDRFELPGLTDSNKLSPAKRQRLLSLIRKQAVALGVGYASSAEIDRYNILQATQQAMIRAVDRLRLPPDYLLVDGITLLPLALPQKTIKQGDNRSFSIAAASVVARVVRDRMMNQYDRRYPGYGFADHKGYDCPGHLQAIAKLGPCPIHRITFRGVKEHLLAVET
jgi:ribonuclease HII